MSDVVSLAGEQARHIRNKRAHMISILVTKSSSNIDAAKELELEAIKISTCTRLLVQDPEAVGEKGEARYAEYVRRNDAITRHLEVIKRLIEIATKPSTGGPEVFRRIMALSAHINDAI